MAAELITGFKILHDVVKKGMDRDRRSRDLLRSLESKLDSIPEAVLQTIAEHNVELGLSNLQIRSLLKMMKDGQKIVARLGESSGFANCLCLGTNTREVEKLERGLEVLLNILKVQALGQTTELLVLARRNRDQLVELKGSLSDIQKALPPRAGDAAQDLVSGCNTETVPDRAQGNASERARTFTLRACSSALCDAVLEANDKAIQLRFLENITALENLTFTLHSLRPLIEEVPKIFRDKPCENLIMEMKKGVHLLHKYSNSPPRSLSERYKCYNEIIGLDAALRTWLSLLKVQSARDVRETSISLRNLGAVVKRFQPSRVLKNQTQTEVDSFSFGISPFAASPLTRFRSPHPNFNLNYGEGSSGTVYEAQQDDIINPANMYALALMDAKKGKKPGEGSFGVVDKAQLDESQLFSAYPSQQEFRFCQFEKLDGIAKATRYVSQLQQLGEGSSGTVYDGQQDDIINPANMMHYPALMDLRKWKKQTFGAVNKAQLDEGQLVFVKRAKKEHLENFQAEFSSEVELLAKIDHPNLVKPLGHVEEGNERLIIMEYVANGTLREHLDGQHGKILEFDQRLEIAIDVAHALTYLHVYAGKQIIHRDVTSSKILLTESMRAKLAYFGFSTKEQGTIGYIDPEYVETGQLAPKNDVYSFGNLLIEIVTGRCPVELKRPVEERVTLGWASKKFNEGKVMELVDPSMKEVVEPEVLVKIFELAFECASPVGADRPDMNSVRVELQEMREVYL